MRIVQILKLLLLTGFLSGCWTASIKDEAPGSLGNIDLLQSFIGQKSESVIRELVLPNELLSDGDKLFMVYSAKSSGTEILMVIWAPVWAFNDMENTLHCLRFELDADNVIKEYRLKSRVMHTLILTEGIDLISGCQEVFWSKKERTKLQIATDFPSTWNPYPSAWEEVIRKAGVQGLAKEEAKKLAIEEAIKRKNIVSLRDSLGKHMTTSELEHLTTYHEENPYAQYKLYTNLKETEPTIAYRWLCASADNGHPQARYTLGQIFEYSKQGHVQAYVWYSLSSYSQSGKFNQESLQSFVDKNLSAAEYQKARIALLEWRPGQCEKSLGLDSDIQQIQ
jgi:hypothetical protein